MFALLAAIFFVVGALARGFEWTGHAGDALIWLLLGLAALSLHYAFGVALPRVRQHEPPA